MTRRDLIFIVGIALALMAAVSGFEILLRGVPEAAPDVGNQSLTPSLSVRSRSNVRAGDSTSAAIVGKLQAGETVAILGTSPGSAGWYYIELPDGTRGYISPDVVETRGDLTDLDRIDPASLSATATLLPATAESSQPGATADAVETQPATPTAAG